MRNLRQSYEEYNIEDVDKKSKEFLKRIIGNEKFDKLKKDGKIEIEVDNKLETGKTIYELHSNGRVINKTKNQSYCIVADRSDYPIDDMIAIKYAHLVYNNELAEKVANKTPLDIYRRSGSTPISVAYGDFVRDMEQRGWSRQQTNIGDVIGNTPGGTPGYSEYVDYLSGRGWHRELITLDQNNTNIVTTWNMSKGNTGRIADVRCPAGMKMSIMGISQIPQGVDPNVAYSLGLYATDENGDEIPGTTKIRITKERSSEFVIQLARIFYEDIKMSNGEAIYRFKKGIEINGEDHIIIYIVSSQSDIPIENVKFRMETDLWARDM